MEIFEGEKEISNDQTNNPADKSVTIGSKRAMKVRS